MVTNSFLDLDTSLFPLIRGLISFSIEMLFPCPLRIVLMVLDYSIAKDCILTGNEQACTGETRYQTRKEEYLVHPVFYTGSCLHLSIILI